LFLALTGLPAQTDSQSNEQVQQHLSEARIAEAAKDFEKAGAEYRELIRLRPGDADFHQRLALTYHLRNQFQEAIPEFARAIKLDPSLWGSHLFLGMDYYRINQFEKALAPLLQSVKLDPSHAEQEARFWLGATYAALGRHRNAIREYRRAA